MCKHCYPGGGGSSGLGLLYLVYSCDWRVVQVPYKWIVCPEIPLSIDAPPLRKVQLHGGLKNGQPSPSPPGIGSKSRTLGDWLRILQPCHFQWLTSLPFAQAPCEPQKGILIHSDLTGALTPDYFVQAFAHDPLISWRLVGKDKNKEAENQQKVYLPQCLLHLSTLSSTFFTRHTHYMVIPAPKS